MVALFIEPGDIVTRIFTLESERLILRPWRAADLVAFRRLSADREVMEFFPKTLTASESDELAGRIMLALEKNAWGLWAVEDRGSGVFMGCVGLNIPGYDLPCLPCVEVGWRLARSFWGQGYATEAARAALYFGFHHLGLDEIVAFTALQNQRSQRVMERLGMQCHGEYFDHPLLEEGDALRRHVLFRLTKVQWKALASPTEQAQIVVV